MIPATVNGVEVMSIGFLVPPGEALIWRGPMLHKAIEQLLGDVAWSDLDYLIVDMPPGTGDAQLSLTQLVPLTGGIIVTTPQNVALSDALRGLTAFKRMEVPVLGIVENMAGEVFGVGGGEAGRGAVGRAVPWSHLPGFDDPGRRRCRQADRRQPAGFRAGGRIPRHRTADRRAGQRDERAAPAGRQSADQAGVVKLPAE